MPRISLRRDGRPGATLARAFWALMLIGHGPATLSVISNFINGEIVCARSLLLLVTQALFLLKIVDPAWLRLPNNGRSRFAVLVLILMLHSGVFERVIVRGEELPPTVPLLTFGGGIGAAAVLGSTPQRVEKTSRPRRQRSNDRATIRRILDAAAFAWFAPRYFLLAHSCALHRAPPH